MKFSALPVLPNSEVASSPSIDPPPVSRERLRSRRKREVRARSISIKRLTKRELALGRALNPEDPDLPRRPRTRAECENDTRPCPFVSCVHHLYLDVSAKTGAIKLNFPDLEVWEMAETCSLDVAARGETTLENVGAIMNLTRERVRQVEVVAHAKLKARQEMASLRDFYGDAVGTKRRLPVVQPSEDAAREFDPETFASDDLDD